VVVLEMQQVLHQVQTQVQQALVQVVLEWEQLVMVFMPQAEVVEVAEVPL
jgi:hypothetical protein